MLELVFVCTGNRFRSPIAAALFRKETNGLPVNVRSAGLLDLGPIPALDEALALADELGIDLHGHAARPLASIDLHGVDLVIGFERMHVVSAVMEGKVPLERAFTLPELVRLLDGLPAPEAEEPVSRARQLVAAAQAMRPPGRENIGRPELRDPFGGPNRLYRKIAEAVRDETRQLAAGLFGPGLTPNDRS
jgi:protein-tyrosine phosphatase